jgi:hypothetical protein
MTSNAIRTNRETVNGSTESGGRKGNALRTPPAIQPRLKSSTPLTRKKIMAAWIRLSKTIQQFCDQPLRDCSVCLVSAERLVFRHAIDSQALELSLNGTLITKTFEDDREFIEIVRTKTSGTAFEVAGRRLSATMFALKLLSVERRAQGTQRAASATMETPRLEESQILSPEVIRKGPPRVFLAAEIVSVLTEASILPVKQVIQRVGIAKRTFNQWEDKYAGLRTHQVQRMLSLEAENVRLSAFVRALKSDKKMLQNILSEKTRRSMSTKREQDSNFSPVDVRSQSKEDRVA